MASFADVALDRKENHNKEEAISTWSNTSFNKVCIVCVQFLEHLHVQRNVLRNLKDTASQTKAYTLSLETHLRKEQRCRNHKESLESNENADTFNPIRQSRKTQVVHVIHSIVPPRVEKRVRRLDVVSAFGLLHSQPWLQKPQNSHQKKANFQYRGDCQHRPHTQTQQQQTRTKTLTMTHSSQVANVNQKPGPADMSAGVMTPHKRI